MKTSSNKIVRPKENLSISSSAFMLSTFLLNKESISILKNSTSLRESKALSFSNHSSAKYSKINLICTVPFGSPPPSLESSFWQVRSCTSSIIPKKHTILTISALQPCWYNFHHQDLWNFFRFTLYNRNNAQDFRRNGLSSRRKATHIQLMCIYGYSLTSFLPVTAICFIKSWVIQTVILGIAFGFSTIFLIRGVLSLNKELGSK